MNGWESSEAAPRLRGQWTSGGDRVAPAHLASIARRRILLGAGALADFASAALCRLAAQSDQWPKWRGLSHGSAAVLQQSWARHRANDCPVRATVQGLAFCPHTKPCGIAALQCRSSRQLAGSNSARIPLCQFPFDHRPHSWGERAALHCPSQVLCTACRSVSRAPKSLNAEAYVANRSLSTVCGLAAS